MNQDEALEYFRKVHEGKTEGEKVAFLEGLMLGARAIELLAVQATIAMSPPGKADPAEGEGVGDA